MSNQLGTKAMEEVTQAMAASGGAAASSGNLAFIISLVKSAISAIGSSWIGGIFIAVLTMAFAKPKSTREMVLAFASMLSFAVWGSAFVIFYFHMSIPEGIEGHHIRSGIAAICGAPGWLIVRAWFKWSEEGGIDSIVSLFNAIIKRIKGSGE